MARPVRCRRICVEPKYDSFIPCGAENTEQVLLTVDDFEDMKTQVDFAKEQATILGEYDLKEKGVENI